ncbi:MAG: hypothetical protein IPN81_09765 [Nitrosomonadales bacterium]|nr:hypothetical protein [Nitrosomonadales bacterium]
MIDNDCTSDRSAAKVLIDLFVGSRRLGHLCARLLSKLDAVIVRTMLANGVVILST